MSVLRTKLLYKGLQYTCLLISVMCSCYKSELLIIKILFTDITFPVTHSSRVVTDYLV